METTFEKKLAVALSGKVDVSNEQEVFTALVGDCIRILVLHMEARIVPVFESMTQTRWHSVEDVGDQSDFVGHLLVELANLMPVLRSLLSSVHFRFVCDNRS